VEGKGGDGSFFELSEPSVVIENLDDKMFAFFTG